MLLKYAFLSASLIATLDAIPQSSRGNIFAAPAVGTATTTESNEGTEQAQEKSASIEDNSESKPGKGLRTAAILLGHVGQANQHAESAANQANINKKYSESSRDCGYKEVFSYQGYENTCDSYLGGAAYPRSIATSKCVCQNQYVRKHANGKCIRPQECCGANERLPNAYDAYQQYERVCENYGNWDSQPRCPCSAGYIRSRPNGVCIPQNSCRYGRVVDAYAEQRANQQNMQQEARENCPTNEEWNQYGSQTEISCSGQSGSSASAVQGCICRNGYRRKVAGGKCVRVQECCGVNEGYSWGNKANEKSCATVGQTSATWTNTLFGGGYACFCNYGYIRSQPNGPCVPKRDCQVSALVTCKANEVLRPGTLPEPTCRVPNPTVYRQSHECYCADGYVRQYRNGPCILTGSCPYSGPVVQIPINNGINYVPINSVQVGIPLNNGINHVPVNARYQAPRPFFGKK